VKSFLVKAMMTSEFFSDQLMRAASLFDSRLPDYIATLPALAAIRQPSAWGMGLDEACNAVVAGGKRVRPALALLASEALNVPLDQAMSIAMTIELFHNFTLIHDDIEDGDEMRRGRPTVWKRFGTDIAINAGGYVHSLAFDRVLALRSSGVNSEGLAAIFSLLSRVSCRTHIGQALDISSRLDRSFSLFTYYRLVLHKTGFCLAFPLTASAVLAGFSEVDVNRLDSLGRRFGLLFQIVDDLIDLTAAKGRGEVGSDIREGKRSFLVALSQTILKPRDLNRLYDILDTPRESTDSLMIDEAMGLYSEFGVEKKARAILASISSEVEQRVSCFPSKLRKTLISFRDYLVGRCI
jgi:geranylgeranyl pyrophosphate synthase